ncbi:MAG: hypothetical protein EBY18_01710 [Alphaproteobacteria bacterium]|nr:hypothetical protein [Alphaproteobacteria bacterium]
MGVCESPVHAWATTNENALWEANNDYSPPPFCTCRRRRSDAGRALTRARASRLAQGGHQDHRALSARRLDRPGSPHYPGQDDRKLGLEYSRTATFLNPAFATGLPYKDSELFNVMQIGRTPQAICAHPDRPYKTFAEVITDAKARPGKVNVGVLGASQALVLMTLIKKENGVDLNLIPYKGGGPLNQDILAGVTDVAIGSLTSFSPHVRANKVRALAVTGEKRTPALPDTSTLIEQGVKAFPSYSWWGVYAPTGTPRLLVDRMHAEIKKAVLAPDVTQKFVDQFNMEILTTSPEEFAAYQKSEQERWFKVIKDNDIKGD